MWLAQRSAQLLPQIISCEIDYNGYLPNLTVKLSDGNRKRCSSSNSDNFDFLREMGSAKQKSRLGIISFHPHVFTQPVHAEPNTRNCFPCFGFWESFGTFTTGDILICKAKIHNPQSATAVPSPLIGSSHTTSLRVIAMLFQWILLLLVRVIAQLISRRHSISVISAVSTIRRRPISLRQPINRHWGGYKLAIRARWRVIVATIDCGRGIAVSLQLWPNHDRQIYGAEAMASEVLFKSGVYFEKRRSKAMWINEGLRDLAIYLRCCHRRYRSNPKLILSWRCLRIPGSVWSSTHMLELLFQIMTFYVDHKAPCKRNK